MLRSFNSLLEIVRNYGKIISNNYGAYTHYEWRRDMKKSLVGLFFLACFAVVESDAASPGVGSYAEHGCVKLNKECDRNDNEVLQIPGVGCFICEDTYCNSGDIVSVAGKASVRGSGGKSYNNHIFECKRGGAFFDDKWEASPIPDCTDPEYVKLKNDANAEYGVVNPDTGTVTVNDNVSYVIRSNKVCMGYVCKVGYKDVNGVCVNEKDITANASCVSTGGVWANGKCSCSASKNIKLAANGETCECINSNYESDGVNGCRKKQSVIDSENNQQRKKACEDSGGSWANNQCACDNAKNLKVSNNVCVCLDDVNYKRNGDRCDLTDAAALQQKCLSESSVASGAYWDDVNKQCRCTNQQYSWNGSICDMNPAILKCLQITGANWNYTTNQCYCVEVGKVINAEQTACVDANTASSGNGSSASASSEVTITQNRARENISSAVAKIEDIKSGLKLTVWRDEEGNFNTSRLLSDSIAGVVLGTAGGLITSNVVKKNQVENGFEDIQCSVGGQVVAGWGDEFRVGIQ